MKRIILAAIAVLLMSVTTNAEQNKILSKDSVLSKFLVVLIALGIILL